MDLQALDLPILHILRGLRPWTKKTYWDVVHDLATNKPGARGDFRLLMRLGAPVNGFRQEDDHWKRWHTPMCRVVHQRNVEAAAFLVELGADVNLEEDEGEDILEIALWGQGGQPDWAMVRFLLQSLDVNRRRKETVYINDGWCTEYEKLRHYDRNQDDEWNPSVPVLLALRGQTELLGIALDAGWEIEEGEDGREETRLIAASFGGHTDTVALLLSRGASLQKQGRFGDTALSAACMGEKREVVELLLAHGAEVNQEPQQRGLYTALGRAAQRCDSGLIDLLISRGAAVDGTGSNGKWPLLLATLAKDIQPAERQREVCQSLINKGADVKKRYAMPYSDNAPVPQSTILHYLYRAQKYEELDHSLIRILTEGGADVNAEDRGGDTVKSLEERSRQRSERCSARTWRLPNFY
uniref:Uncharacterized protein n=1 Tax=Chromera velia CCMP2878 TaxID=1169474 RepID=A0A0G4H9X5_9ALVE|eukprot:Cvel_886.t1-p1 / transcript=Cvel_886.t1 / gene=Cvel_886 / organism=Chromera_velia_CCMP2878 / gene_product=Ankyrin repeat domain-containing protein 50, putative / transcript_product=Ankyrin repeat domain-containing protein 50, putative / location=Cvel_scaffold28:45310-46542(-) / protein_length=411 / sequence_SO=supercontig / SO=protein_coding / is_pseudo=false